LLGLLFASASIAAGDFLGCADSTTGVLALVAYSKDGFVSWKTGFLLIPGSVLGGIAGGILAEKIKPRSMRQVFAGVLGAARRVAGAIRVGGARGAFDPMV